jgi:hypothetical protein
MKEDGRFRCTGSARRFFDSGPYRRGASEDDDALVTVAQCEDEEQRSGKNYSPPSQWR